MSRPSRYFTAIIACCLAVCAIVGGSALASLPGRYAPASDTPRAYPVRLKLAYDGRILGTPEIYVREDSATIISVPRTQGYALRTVLKREDMNGRVMARLDFEIFRESDGLWQPVSTPVLIMPFGGKAHFALDRPGGGQPLFELDASMGQPITAAIGTNTCSASRQANWEASMKKPVTVLASQDTLPDASGGGCCQGGCFRCCGPAVCCADPRNCSGSCCT